MTDGGFKACE
jgi:hypothetical protein